MSNDPLMESPKWYSRFVGREVPLEEGSAHKPFPGRQDLARALIGLDGPAERYVLIPVTGMTCLVSVEVREVSREREAANVVTIRGYVRSSGDDAPVEVKIDFKDRIGTFRVLEERS